MDKSKFLQSKISDRIRQASEDFYITNTEFLDLHEQTLARALLREAKDVHGYFFGGYDDAERRILILSPVEYGELSNEAQGAYLQLLRVKIVRTPRHLTHRDYLGAVLGLGIERRMIGDILVREDGADLIVCPEITPFLLQEYHSVGRADVTAMEEPLEKLIVPEGRVKEFQDTVPSLRLDNLVSTAFKVSRSDAAKAIRSGIVSVNHMEALKVDQRVEEGEVLNLRGKGKAVLKSVGGESKKGRIWVEIKQYV